MQVHAYHGANSSADNFCKRALSVVPALLTRTSNRAAEHVLHGGITDIAVHDVHHPAFRPRVRRHGTTAVSSTPPWVRFLTAMIAPSRADLSAVARGDALRSAGDDAHFVFRP
ncbi:hypothetical protein JIR23_06715 [Bradyrhizobium diazoefficiens]|nr:hypothetical protein [Bradyrhizobium diazoefficiens]QQN65443.1 hypothetical protein JIR23_06715 [Bradyrhizobium diazoefficiens]